MPGRQAESQGFWWEWSWYCNTSSHYSLINFKFGRNLKKSQTTLSENRSQKIEKFSFRIEYFNGLPTLIATLSGRKLCGLELVRLHGRLVLVQMAEGILRTSPLFTRPATSTTMVVRRKQAAVSTAPKEQQYDCIFSAEDASSSAETLVQKDCVAKLAVRIVQIDVEWSTSTFWKNKRNFQVFA